MTSGSDYESKCEFEETNQGYTIRVKGKRCYVVVDPQQMKRKDLLDLIGMLKSAHFVMLEIENAE